MRKPSDEFTAFDFEGLWEDALDMYRAAKDDQARTLGNGDEDAGFNNGYLHGMEFFIKDERFKKAVEFAAKQYVAQHPNTSGGIE